MHPNLNIELPLIIDDNSRYAPFIIVFDKDGNKLSKIQSLNTETLEAEVYVYEEGSKRLKLDEWNKVVTEKVQLDNITLKFKE